MVGPPVLAVGDVLGESVGGFTVGERVGDDVLTVGLVLGDKDASGGVGDIEGEYDTLLGEYVGVSVGDPEGRFVGLSVLRVGEVVGLHVVP
jgi:hypothetical protein